MTSAGATCTDINSAVRSFIEHGFCVVDPALTNLDPNVLLDMQHWCEQYKPVSDNAFREDSKLRYTMNRFDNILFPEWQHLVKELLQDGDSNFVYIVDGIIASVVDEYKRWFLRA